MKKTIALFLLVFFTFSSCKEIDKLTQFNIDYSSTITVNSTFGIDIPFDIYTPNISTNSENTFEVNDTRKDLIEEILLTELKLTIESPASQDFDFLKSIEIYISAEGLDEIKIAWKDDIPQNGLKTIELEKTGNDLKEYIKADEFQLRSHTVTRHLISTDTDIEINSVFFVDAKILGI